MVTYQDDVLSSFQNGDEGFRLCGLSGLVNEYLSEPDLPNSSVEGSYTSSADHVCILQNFILSLLNKVFQLFVFFLV